MNFGVDSARNLSTLPKKDRSGQQQSETLESVILDCLRKMDKDINGYCAKLLKQIQTIKELLGVWHCFMVLMIIAIVKEYWNILIPEANGIDSPMKGAWHGIKMMNHLRGDSCYSYLIWLFPFELW